MVATSRRTTRAARANRGVGGSNDARSGGGGFGAGTSGSGAGGRRSNQNNSALLKRRSSKPARKWFQVDRPPAAGVGFVVPVWVPFEKLTSEERDRFLNLDPEIQVDTIMDETTGAETDAVWGSAEDPLDTSASSLPAGEEEPFPFPDSSLFPTDFTLNQADTAMPTESTKDLAPSETEKPDEMQLDASTSEPGFQLPAETSSTLSSANDASLPQPGLNDDLKSPPPDEESPASMQPPPKRQRLDDEDCPSIPDDASSQHTASVRDEGNISTEISVVVPPLNADEAPVKAVPDESTSKPDAGMLDSEILSAVAADPSDSTLALALHPEAAASILADLAESVFSAPTTTTTTTTTTTEPRADPPPIALSTTEPHVKDVLGANTEEASDEPVDEVTGVVSSKPGMQESDLALTGVPLESAPEPMILNPEASDAGIAEGNKSANTSATSMEAMKDQPLNTSLSAFEQPVIEPSSEELPGADTEEASPTTKNGTGIDDDDSHPAPRVSTTEAPPEEDDVCEPPAKRPRLEENPGVPPVSTEESSATISIGVDLTDHHQHGNNEDHPSSNTGESLNTAKTLVPQEEEDASAIVVEAPTAELRQEIPSGVTGGASDDNAKNKSSGGDP